MSFTHKFGKNGYLGDVCAVGYADFFNKAIPVVSNACKNFVRPK